MFTTKKEVTREELWDSFKNTRSDAVKEKLIVEYAPLVKYVSGRVATNLPSNVEFDDLVSYGVFGLIDAIEKFDYARGVKFETYAVSRIRGAILDGLRSIDWVPRSTRQKAKELEETYYRLENTLGRPATDDELAKALNISIQEFHSLLNEVNHTSLASLDEMLGSSDDDGDSVRLIEMIQDPNSEDPSKNYQVEELKRTLADAVDKLPEREKMVVSLYYYDELTFREIGQVLGVSESRISQMHTKAILRLRGRLSRVKKHII